GRELAELSVSASLRGADLHTTMESLLGEQPLEWSLKGNTIVIKQSQPTLNRAVPTSSKSQQYVLRGAVTNTSGEPLTGVTVRLEASDQATSTDREGRFMIQTNVPETILHFSLLGYRPEERQVDGASDTLHIQLQEIQSDLEEVVVVGYGTQRKRDLTGAVSKVDGNDLKIGRASCRERV